MAKKVKCKILLHGIRDQRETHVFDSISEAKKWVRECWFRPYTIVRIKD